MKAQTCPSCNGTGVAPHDMDCSICGGYGYIQSPVEEDENDLYDFWNAE